jgi:hypothetical protein
VKEIASIAPRQAIALPAILVITNKTGFAINVTLLVSDAVHPRPAQVVQDPIA